MKNPMNKNYTRLNYVKNQIIFNNEIAVSQLHEIGISRHHAHRWMSSQCCQALFHFVRQSLRGGRVIGSNKGDHLGKVFLGDT